MIPSDKMNKFKNKIKEGVVYRIQLYLIVWVKEKYRAIDHPRLSFINKTIVDPISPQPPSSQCTSVYRARKTDWIKIILISG
jgi:hypothetical protein